MIWEARAPSTQQTEGSVSLQAVLCRLEGAEELAAHALGGELVRGRLPGETLVAAPGARPDPADPSVPLVLYDTTTQRDLNLNREIVHDFCIAGAFAVTQVCTYTYTYPTYLYEYSQCQKYLIKY